jgi:hypothetical protein
MRLPTSLVARLLAALLLLTLPLSISQHTPTFPSGKVLHSVGDLLAPLGARTVQAAEPGEELLNGSGNLTAFSQLSIPLYVSSPTNLRLQISGGSVGDTVTLTLRSGGNPLSTWTVRTGETIWAFANILSGSQLTLENPGSSQLSWSLSAYVPGIAPNITQDETTWSGASQGAGMRSSIQLNVAEAGLHRLTLGAQTGSFQIKIDDNAVLKTVAQGAAPDPADSTYYLTAGVHTLSIIHDPAASRTEWSVALTPTGSVADTLPSAESGVQLGGPNAFREEWVPIQTNAAGPINLKIVASGGNPGDSLLVELYNGNTLASRAEQVLSGETFWTTSDLGTGDNRLHIVAAPTNTASMSYQIIAADIPTIPSSVQGVAMATGLTSTFRLNAPASGTYNVVITTTEGLAQVVIDPMTGIQARAIPTPASTAVLRVPLNAGLHTFVIEQDRNGPRAVWEVAVSPRRIDAVLAVNVVTPTLAAVGQATQVGLIGQGFDSSTRVELVGNDGTVTALSAVIVSATEIQASLPGNLAAGRFNLRLTNGDGATTTVDQAITVTHRIFLPVTFGLLQPVPGQ